MVIYITTYDLNEPIQDALSSVNLNILNAIVINNFDLQIYIKQNLEQFNTLSTFIIDISSLKSNDEEICLALENFRMIYSNVQIIIISPNRKPGDNLLSQIFSMGIYDIIGYEDEDKELLRRELIKSLNERKSFKDSIKYKEASFDKNKQIKEKIVIKREIQQTVSKALVGFCGTQSRIGVTHNTIVSANYLRKKGYKVAIVENSLNKDKSFELIKEAFDEVIEQDDFFILDNLDYYPNYDISQIHKIVAKNYNFICIDFGEFKEEYRSEFNRCVIQVIVSGSKPWEIGFINNIFDQCSTDELKEFIYLFNFTDISQMQEIRENMQGLNKIYFASYVPDPFTKTITFPDLDFMFQLYVGNKDNESQERSFLKGVKDSIYENILKKKR